MNNNSKDINEKKDAAKDFRNQHRLNLAPDFFTKHNGQTVRKEEHTSEITYDEH